MRYPRQLRDHDPARLADRDASERMHKPRPLERPLILPLTLTNHRQEVQSAPLTLGSYLIRLPAQYCVGAFATFLVHGGVPEHLRPDGCHGRTRRTVRNLGSQSCPLSTL
jgi:hypothetical protein